MQTKRAMNWARWATVLIWLAAGTTALADGVTGTKQSSRLYTAQDSSAAGGIHARVSKDSPAILQAFAVPADDSFKVYKGAVGTDGHEFSFKGLPVAKYDLMLVASEIFFEGFTLAAEPDSLTTNDRTFITTIVNLSVPFFDTKKIHRCIGTTGSSGKARCVLQEVRTRPVTLQDATERADIQIRSLKLAVIEDVGSAGWQLTQTRELVRKEVTLQDRQGVLPHAYNPILGGIRVTDSVKELGEIDLTKGSMDSDWDKPRRTGTTP